MTKLEFINRMIGKPWKNRACTFEACDCWALVVLYYRHVLNIEIHHDAGYESDHDFVTCYNGEVEFWQRTKHPVDDGIFIGYLGSQPAHIGLIIDGKVFHSRGENGAVRMDRLIVLEKKFTKLEFMKYADS